MDLDDFDDDIADEDFLAALDQASSSHDSQPLGAATANALNGKTASVFAPTTSPWQGTSDIDLGDLPSDAFSSPEPERQAKSVPVNQVAVPAPRGPIQRTSSATYRQTTLFGGSASSEAPSRSQLPTNRVFRTDLPREEPSHHVLDRDAMSTWVYPTNLGAIRDYQFSIVKNSLFNNTLVALPTGLGKTFIAATVMLNFYRWTKTAKIVFVAPTKPLVAQQIDACYQIVGIPRSDTTLLTGDIAPALRVDEWQEKRVFFMTPQTLLNDLSHGYADPKSIALLVVDEAHRAVGEYAYAKVTKLIRRFSTSMRVLALTATPGSKVETVQEVIDNLGINHCEIRTEDSIDIRQYVHSRDIEQRVLDPSDEMNLISELFTKALKPMMEKLSAQNIWYARNPMALTSFGLMQAQKEWFESRGRHANQGLQGMMRAIFTTLTSIAHSIKLLNFHGIKPFFDNLNDMRSEQESKGAKGSKYKRQLIEDASFQEMMSRITQWLRTDGFVGHPKLTALADSVLNHFMDHGESSATRVIVFSEYRDSAEEIVRTLNTHKPLIKASVFVGQADGKRNEGMKQAQQIATIERFRKGEFNVLVATSIGEEGLDIGQVDLIICYDSSASPIRMLQRMGRTGRKRAGQIVLLLMRGKEEEQFAKSKDNYEKMQKLICEGSRFNFRFDLSTRIVPRDIQPQVDKRSVEIPPENTQDKSLPEPKKRGAAKGKKKPPKKFHMPDGVETGFQKVSDLLKGQPKKNSASQRRNAELRDTVELPKLEQVLLRDSEVKELDRSYRDLPFNNRTVEETYMPNLSAHPTLQRKLQKVVHLKHSQRTKRCVKMLGRISTSAINLSRACREADTSGYLEIPVKGFVNSEGETETSDEEDGPRKRRRTSGSPSDQVPATTVLPQSKAQPKPKPKPKTKPQAMPTIPAQKQKRGSAFTAAKAFLAVESGGGTNDFDDDDDLDESDEDEEGEEAPKRKGSGRGRRKKKTNRHDMGRHGINSDEVGDACDRDSDAMESDGSDDGEDLLDFVVSDNQIPSSMPDTDGLSSSIAHATPARRLAASMLFTPTQVSLSQDSDGMPDIDELLGSKQRAKARISDIIEVDEDEEAPAPKKVVRGRRQVLESDSDE
ncbi:type III restriction enzyme, res subunit domain-containing protein [Sarocladium implicatum]|nr:type III restriction enzyme, res subunit domain-containing protein [Sarocladium implicatum]